MKSNRPYFLFLISIIFLQAIYAQNKLTPTYIVQQIIQYNLDLKVLENNIRIAKNNNNLGLGAGNAFGMPSSNASFLPQISLTGGSPQSPLGFGQNKSKQEYSNPAFNVNNQLNNTTLLAPSLNAIWYLFDGLKMFNTKKKLNESVVLTDLQYRQALENTVLAALTLYYQIVSTKEYIRYLNTVLSIVDLQKQLAQDKLKIGTASETDVLQTKIDYNNAKAQIIQQQSVLIQYKANLNAMMSKKPDEDFDVEDSIIVQTTLDYQNAISTLDEQNSTMLITKKNMDIDMLGLKEYKSSYFPKIGLVGSYNFSRSTNTIGLMRVSQNLGYAAGFAVSWNLLNHLSTRTAIKNQKVILNSDNIKIEATRINEKTNIFNAYTTFKSWTDVWQLYNENFLLAKSNLLISSVQYQKGHTDYVTYKLSEQTYENTLYNKTVAVLNAKISELNYLKVSGTLIKSFTK